MPQRSRHVLTVVDIFLPGNKLGAVVSGSNDEKQTQTLNSSGGGRTHTPGLLPRPEREPLEKLPTPNSWSQHTRASALLSGLTGAAFPSGGIRTHRSVTGGFHTATSNDLNDLMNHEHTTVDNTLSASTWVRLRREEHSLENKTGVFSGDTLGFRLLPHHSGFSETATSKRTAASFLLANSTSGVVPLRSWLPRVGTKSLAELSEMLPGG